MTPYNTTHSQLTDDEINLAVSAALTNHKIYEYMHYVIVLEKAEKSIETFLNKYAATGVPEKYYNFLALAVKQINVLQYLSIIKQPYETEYVLHFVTQCIDTPFMKIWCLMASNEIALKKLSMLEM
jgi:hypothetical protein